MTNRDDAPRYATLTQAAEALGLTRKTAFKQLKSGAFMIENYEGRNMIAAALGVEMNSVRSYMRKGKLKISKVGTTVIAPVGQFGEQNRKGWPEIPLKTYRGPRVGKDVIVPHMDRTRKDYRKPPL